MENYSKNVVKLAVILARTWIRVSDTDNVTRYH